MEKLRQAIVESSAAFRETQGKITRFGQVSIWILDLNNKILLVKNDPNLTFIQKWVRIRKLKKEIRLMIRRHAE